MQVAFFGKKVHSLWCFVAYPVRLRSFMHRLTVSYATNWQLALLYEGHLLCVKSKLFGYIALRWSAAGSQSIFYRHIAPLEQREPSLIAKLRHVERTGELPLM